MNTDIEKKDNLEKAKEIFQEKYMQSIREFKAATDKIEIEEKIVNHLLKLITAEDCPEYGEIIFDDLLKELKIKCPKPWQLLDDCIYVIKELINSNIAIIRTTDKGPLVGIIICKL